MINKKQEQSDFPTYCLISPDVIFLQEKENKRSLQSRIMWFLSVNHRILFPHGYKENLKLSASLPSGYISIRLKEL